MKLNKLSILLVFVQLGLSLYAFSQKPDIQRIDPSNWWVGMKNPNLQILVYGKNIATSNLSLKPYSGVKLKKIQKVENPNYLFIDLEIAKNTKAGKLQFTVGNTQGSTKIDYELRNRTAKPQAVTQSDVVYLLMPDRFANGDESNDKFANMNDPEADRKSPWLRHGGDLQGVIDHLDYFKELGVTALWMTPIIENNTHQSNEGGTMRSSYHGYHFTDHYQIDKRFGGNEAYLKLIGAAHKKGIKIVQDAVYNHVSEDAWFNKDLPSKTWIHHWDKYTNTSYKDQPLFDVNGSAYDKKVTSDGWFTAFLPDLDQKDPLLANYLIQHALWTIEYFNIDSWRIDTYIYNDMEFMNRCNKAILDEHPQMLLFGESAVNTPISQAYFTRNNLNIPFKCNLPAGCDFVVQGAINSSLNEDFGWTNGVNRLYQTLAQDIVYQNPEKLVPFVENHDTDRFFSVIGEDFNKYKIGLTWLYTLRGIPQMYYGTEFLMKNFKNPTDAEVRKDFPGGFKGDAENKFTAAGRNAKENEAFDFNKKLLNYRKTSEALTKGKFKQFTPFDNGIYVYFRYTDKQTVMVVSNTKKSEASFSTENFAEVIKGAKSAKNIMTGEVLNDISNLKVPAMTAVILELK
ncbi:glycoside hydrolase family 13 protein [Emticicia sp. SJ17W-69]|uniref:glycoside hydrolase family 13 protein n=1 Tax=Emticicia sp. SJ17W-69 TaxID=3421657 RepID=UPI003EBEA9B8